MVGDESFDANCDSYDEGKAGLKIVLGQSH